MLSICFVLEGRGGNRIDYSKGEQEVACWPLVANEKVQSGP
jgi:hypothetical protein